MKNRLKKFNIRQNQKIKIDDLMNTALYKPKVGYYSHKMPFGKKGDFVTSPTISNLFSEIIAIWIISSWEILGKPKIFNFVELGPGDGSLLEVLIRTFKKFSTFNNSVKIFLYEKSEFLKKIQKKKIKGVNVKWIKNFHEIKGGPVIFFGNEFFDAIPIKQFYYTNKVLLEKCYIFNGKKLEISQCKPNLNDLVKLKSFKVLKQLKFIEYPKLGLKELNKIAKKIKSLSGGVLLIDYGYVEKLNTSTIQIIMKNKKIHKNSLLKYIGEADITSLVNFGLLNEFFLKEKLEVKKIVSQKFFLERMGIIERAKILEKRMNKTQKEYMFTTLSRLLDKGSMGELFKVIFAYKSNNKKFFGFE
tara:strand:+ start:635 stop:1711 length:1077 start_codon:yes stop_codon:yes gene_type:complete